MSLYQESQFGKTFPLYGVTASYPTAPAGIASGNGNASPPQSDLVSGTASNPAAHAAAARAAGVYTAMQPAFHHPLVWAIGAIQAGFILLAVIAHQEERG